MRYLEFLSSKIKNKKSIKSYILNSNLNKKNREREKINQIKYFCLFYIHKFCPI
jgi:hypothetical protein